MKNTEKNVGKDPGISLGETSEVTKEVPVKNWKNLPQKCRKNSESYSWGNVGKILINIVIGILEEISRVIENFHEELHELSNSEKTTL